MKIKVVSTAGDNPRMISFSCVVGNGSARWGGQHAPEHGGVHDVELDVDIVLQQGFNFERAGEREPSIAMKDDTVYLMGLVESADDDGLLYFRLHESCLMMIESKCGAEIVGEWIKISVPASSFVLTPQ